MARSLNRVQLIGNLTRDPELRYTPSGTAVCTFSIATNRNWTTDGGDKKEEVEFHRVVSWNKLAELCSQFLVKGRKVFVEGRLQTRSWTAQDGAQKQTTEIVISDMILLDSKRQGEVEQSTEPKEEPAPAKQTAKSKTKDADKEEPTQEDPSTGSGQEAPQESPSEDITPDDIPF